MKRHEFLCLKCQRATRGRGVLNFRKTVVTVLLAALVLYPTIRDAAAAPSEIERVGALINVSNLDVSLDFFTRLVGLKEAARVPIGPGAWEVLLSPGGTDVEGQIALVYTPGAIKTVDQGNGFNRLVLFTSTEGQVDRIASKIAAAGYATVIPPSTAEIPGGRKYRYTHMKGPDGYTVELTWFDPAVHIAKP
jgi:catechol 2,3-dioxygenase-like lactoylglutathione lyase family enzyme